MRRGMPFETGAKHQFDAEVKLSLPHPYRSSFAPEEKKNSLWQHAFRGF